MQHRTIRAKYVDVEFVRMGVELDLPRSSYSACLDYVQQWCKRNKKKSFFLTCTYNDVKDSPCWQITFIAADDWPHLSKEMIEQAMKAGLNKVRMPVPDLYERRLYADPSD